MENLEFEMRMHLDTGMRELVNIETGKVVDSLSENHTFPELRAWANNIRKNITSQWSRVFYCEGKAVAE